MVPDALTVAIDLYKNSDAARNSLWGLYSGASLALLGYVLGSKTPVPGRGKIGLAVVFLIFALSNARALWLTQSIGYTAGLAVADLCRSAQLGAPPSVLTLLDQLRMSPPQVVVGFQLLLTVCALAAIAAGHLHEKWLREHPVPTELAGSHVVE